MSSTTSSQTTAKNNRFQNLDRTFWTKYEAGRPTVPDTFFTKICDFHAEHGSGSFTTLHDAGSGPATHTARLATRFERVIVSDPSESSIEIARDRLRDFPHCEFRIASMNNTAEIEENSVDLLLGLNMIHLTNLNEAINAAAFQLKPGGTLALATFCYVVLDHEPAQAILEEIFAKAGEDLMERRGELDGLTEPHKSARAVLGTDLDAVPIPETVFASGARRLRINYAPGYSYAKMLIPPQYRDLYLAGASRVGPDDQIEFENDDDWKIELDFQRIRELFQSHPLREDADGVPDLWNRLKGVIGDDPITGRWAVNLILATKK